MVRMSKFWSWLSIVVLVVGVLSCGQSAQQKLNASTRALRTCADGEELTADEEAALQKRINAGEDVHGGWDA